MVLVHTEEELLATEEPAICVIGATSCETIDAFSNEMNKTYVRIVRENDAYRIKESLLFDEMLADPATRGEATDNYEEFCRERARLVFGTKACDVMGRFNGITALIYDEPL